MKNWQEYIESKFKGITFDRIESKNTNQYYYKLYRRQGTYFEFELTNGCKKISKIECGKYWPTKENMHGYETSCTKAVFDKTKEHLIDFLPVSIAGESGDKYELEYSAENTAILDRFLYIPFEIGWKETYYIYNSNYYRIQFEINFPAKKSYNEIVLLQFFKQNYPIVSPETEKKLRGWWADLFINKGRRWIENEILTPILQSKTI